VEFLVQLQEHLVDRVEELDKEVVLILDQEQLIKDLLEDRILLEILDQEGVEQELQVKKL
jgi:hypothetical protein